MKTIQLSDHFRCSTILLFALPSIGMQLVDNIYQVADGYFISNFISADAFAAENLIFPPLFVVASIGLMFGSGSAALISSRLGKGARESANRMLSLTVLGVTVLGAVLSGLLFVLMPPIARGVGAEESILPYCVEYGRVLALCMPFQILNGTFHSLLIVAERPGLGLALSIVNAAVNIVLDGLFVAVLGWGLRGAALATGLAWILSALVPLFYFRRKDSPLHFVSPGRDLAALLKACGNGASEMLNAVSFSIIAMLFNYRLLFYAGEKGVAACAVSGYVSGIAVAVFYGVAMSVTPVAGYHLGRKNLEELHSLRKNGLIVTGFLGLFLGGLSFLLAEQIACFFVGYDRDLTWLSVEALRMTAFGYPACGMAILCSAYFTGLGDGKSSLFVAGARSFLFPLIGLLLLPGWLGRPGIWMARPLSEIAALLIAFLLLLAHRFNREEKQP